MLDLNERRRQSRESVNFHGFLKQTFGEGYFKNTVIIAQHQKAELWRELLTR